MGRYPWAEVFLFEVLYFVIFYPTRRRIYRAVVLTIMIYLAVQIYLTPEVTDPIMTACTVGSAVCFRLALVAYILCAEGSFPDHWRRVRDEVHVKADPSNPDNLPSKFSPAKKFWWMLDIPHNPRMIGWVQEPRNCLPPHPPPSRWAFFWKTCMKIIFNTFLADLATFVFAGSPAFDSRVHDPADGPETYLAAVPLLRRVPYVLAFGVRMASSFRVLHGILALVCVFFGRASPTLWPDIWGRWSEAYTVRKLWGQTWHQTMRPTFAGLGRLVANKFLKFPRGTNRSSYAQLYFAFFLSGLIHFCGDFMYEKRMVYRSFKFFLLQAVAITFEDLIIYIAKRLLPQGGIAVAITFEDLVIYIAKRLLPRGMIDINLGREDESWRGVAARVVGYCWVALWFCLAMPIWVDGASAVGFFNTDRGPITQVILGTWKQWA